MISFIKKAAQSSLARHSLASGIMKPISMLLSYISVPILLNYLGIEKYGAWMVILSVLSWMAYFDIGIGNGLRNKLTESLAQGDTEKSRELISSAYKMIALIAAAVTAVITAVTLLLDWKSVLSLKEAYPDLKPAIVVSVLCVALNFVLSLCKNVLFAMQMASAASLLDICCQLINCAGILIAAAFSSGSLLLVSIIYGGSSVLVLTLFSALLYTRHTELLPSLRYADNTVGREITTLGLKFFVIQISALVLFTTDSLIISNLYGAENVTPYSIVNKVFTAVIGFHAAFLTPMWSAVTKANSENDCVKVRRIIRSCMMLIIPFAVFALLIAVLFIPITDLWLGQRLDYSGGIIWLGLLYCVVYLWCNTVGLFSNGLNILKGPMIVAVVQAMLNIPLSLFFAKSCGMKSSGIMLGTISVMLIGAVVVASTLFGRMRELNFNEMK